MPSGIISVFLFCLFTLSSACYIQNCPPGGKKRSVRQTDDQQCVPCGPGNGGICITHDVCCGRRMGCYFRTPETKICSKRNFLYNPDWLGKRCAVGSKCQGPGICCRPGGCNFSNFCITRTRCAKKLF